MDFLISGLATLINALATALPSWSFAHDLSVDVATLAPYFQKANTLVPVDTMMTVFSLTIGLELVLIALYWIDRLLNLVRGAG